jgi:hypothetical protein
MKNFNLTKVAIIIASCVLSFNACTSKESSNKDEWPVVATKSGELTVADLSLFGAEKVIPLSFLAEELQIVKLDDSDAALVKNSGVFLSENYILVRSDGQAKLPFKLFDKKTGKFITNIGDFGQGPNEYRNIYDAQLDEANNRVYLLPWQTKQILVYDLTGAYLPPIPICFDAPKGNFHVDTKAGTVIVSVLPFPNAQAVVWQQTLTGELIDSIAPGALKVPLDFSNEVGKYVIGGDYHFNVFTFVPRADSIYRYDVKNKKITAVFTLDYNVKSQTMHMYSELPDYFTGFLAEPKQVAERTQVSDNHRFYIIDKKTLRGTYYSLENDYLGGLKTGWLMGPLSDGYFAQNYDPGDLLDALTKVLETNESLTDEARAKITELRDSIDPDDNNYILYAKLKK